MASEGYAAAAEAARARGFAAVERLAGGRAAVFHEGTIAIARAYSDPQPPKRTYARFEEMAEVIASALGSLGVDARVGEIPGEYCPARTASTPGTTKLAGIGQRMIRGGAHLGGVVVGSGEARSPTSSIPSTARSGSSGTVRPRAASPRRSDARSTPARSRRR